MMTEMPGIYEIMVSRRGVYVTCGVLDATIDGTTGAVNGSLILMPESVLVRGRQMLTEGLPISTRETLTIAELKTSTMTAEDARRILYAHDALMADMDRAASDK